MFQTTLSGIMEKIFVRLAMRSNYRSINQLSNKRRSMVQSISGSVKSISLKLLSVGKTKESTETIFEKTLNPKEHFSLHNKLTRSLLNLIYSSSPHTLAPPLTLPFGCNFILYYFLIKVSIVCVHPTFNVLKLNDVDSDNNSNKNFCAR
jgi:hypothetical protein